MSGSFNFLKVFEVPERINIIALQILVVLRVSESALSTCGAANLRLAKGSSAVNANQRLAFRGCAENAAANFTHNSFIS